MCALYDESGTSHRAWVTILIFVALYINIELISTIRFSHLFKNRIMLFARVKTINIHDSFHCIFGLVLENLRRNS